MKLDKGAEPFSIPQCDNCNYPRLCGDERCNPQIEIEMVLQTLLNNIKRNHPPRTLRSFSNQNLKKFTEYLHDTIEKDEVLANVYIKKFFNFFNIDLGQQSVIGGSHNFLMLMKFDDFGDFKTLTFPKRQRVSFGS